MNKQVYTDFVEDFHKVLQQEHPDVCFYVYGSFAKREHDPRKGSDIDGGLILDSQVVSDKDKVLDISRVLTRCLSVSRVPIDLNLTDNETNMDGRFLSYTEDYTDYLKKSAIVYSEKNYIDKMNGLDYKSGSLYSAAHNLRKVRNSVLESIYNLSYRPDEFVKGLKDSLAKAVKFPKNLLWLSGRDEIITLPDEMRNEIRNILPEFDISLLEELDEARCIEEDGNILDNPVKSLELYVKSLQAIEELIESYIDRFPKTNEREARGN
ncbi:MAG: hypothetical protein Q7S74_02670 [Nanoarchaeota archaeon]|nr:hypothetical protein [Nanoarchaeota archaeon]